MRFSIRDMAFAVLLIAVDCLVLRFAFTANDNFRGFFTTQALLPMVNILAVVAYIAATRHRGQRATLLGFEATGLAATLTLACCLIAAPESWLYRIDEGSRQNLLASAPIKRLVLGLGKSPLAYHATCTLGVVTTAAIFTPALVFIAWVGSLRARRLAGRHALIVTNREEAASG